jgi:glycosyltransferase involved in cell wall biosynthesis
MVLSATNLSLLPLEIMACGTPVVTNKGENVEWLCNSKNAIIADFEPWAIAQVLEQYLKNDDMRAEVVKNAAEFLQDLSWEKEARKIESVLLREVRKLV